MYNRRITSRKGQYVILALIEENVKMTYLITESYKVKLKEVAVRRISSFKE